MKVDACDPLGDQYIGDDNNRKEPQLSEFAKAAIELKSKLHKQAEKPRDNSRAETARCDNLYIKKCLTAMQDLRDTWIGDENQKQPTLIQQQNLQPS